MPETLEQLQNDYLTLQNDFQNTADELATVTAENEQLKRRISELQEHNQKLFLRCTAETQEQAEEKPQMTLAEISKLL